MISARFQDRPTYHWLSSDNVRHCTLYHPPPLDNANYLRQSPETTTMLSLSHLIFLLVSSLLALSTPRDSNTSSKIPANSPLDQIQVKVIDANTIGYNGWEIAGCGKVELMPPKLEYILRFLLRLKPGLEAVIADARLGTRSPHGYTAFFKSATNIRKVILQYPTADRCEPGHCLPRTGKSH